MKRKTNCYLGLASAILLGILSPAGATAPTGVSLGTGAPPGTLGPWTMAPIGPDASPVNSFVTSVGPVLFDEAVTHAQIGNGWASWSHGYAGDVYHTYSSVNTTSLTLTMSAPISAIYFYAEPNDYTNFTFTATALSGASVTETIDGNAGASGFGFYATGVDLITSITITEGNTAGFAVGEFGFSVPEPSSVALASLGLVLLVSRRIQRRTRS